MSNPTQRLLSGDLRQGQKEGNWLQYHEELPNYETVALEKADVQGLDGFVLSNEEYTNKMENGTIDYIEEKYLNKGYDYKTTEQIHQPSLKFGVEPHSDTYKVPIEGEQFYRYETQGKYESNAYKDFDKVDLHAVSGLVGLGENNAERVYYNSDIRSKPNDYNADNKYYSNAVPNNDFALVNVETRYVDKYYTIPQYGQSTSSIAYDTYPDYTKHGDLRYVSSQNFTDKYYTVYGKDYGGPKYVTSQDNAVKYCTDVDSKYVTDRHIPGADKYAISYDSSDNTVNKLREQVGYFEERAARLEGERDALMRGGGRFAESNLRAEITRLNQELREERERNRIAVLSTNQRIQHLLDKQAKSSQNYDLNKETQELLNLQRRLLQEKDEEIRNLSQLAAANKEQIAILVTQLNMPDVEEILSQTVEPKPLDYDSRIPITNTSDDRGYSINKKGYSQTYGQAESITTYPSSAPKPSTTYPKFKGTKTTGQTRQQSPVLNVGDPSLYARLDMADGVMDSKYRGVSLKEDSKAKTEMVHAGNLALANKMDSADGVTDGKYYNVPIAELANQSGTATSSAYPMPSSNSKYQDNARGTVTVFCVGGSGWKDDELIGKSDPYCKVTLAGQTQSTKPHKNAGKTAKWNQTLTFRDVPLNGAGKVEVFDDDIACDDKLGIGIFDLIQALNTNEMRVPLKPFGYVSLKVSSSSYSRH